MKRHFIVSCFLLFALAGFSQFEPNSYYAASRLDYYTNEEVGEVMVYIPERLQDKKITIDVVFEYEVLNRGFQVASSGVSAVPFPMKLLRIGNNEITVSFYEDEKWVDSRKIFVTIREAKDNAVKIERAKGGVVTNGLLDIPVGFYACRIDDLQSLELEAANGFNAVTPYQDNAKKSLKARKAFMDRCAALGIQVNYNVCGLAGGGGPQPFRMDGLSKQEKLDLLKKEIESFRDHPALLSWYMADEPDGRNIPADSLIDFYNLIKELDPYHPVSLLLSSPRNAEQFKKVCDIVIVAPKPVPQGNMLEVKDYTVITKNQVLYEKPLWIAPQVYGGNEGLKREPDAREIRVMTYLGVIYGASGIQNMKRSAPNNFPKSPSAWNACSELAMEIAEITPDILSTMYAPVIVADNPTIHAKAWNRNGLVTIAVANTNPDPTKFKIKLQDLDVTVVAKLLFENRQLVVTSGTIEDIIDGYGTMMYRFDVRHETDQVKGIMAGNLTTDPGFEDLSSNGVPAACFSFPGEGSGCTFFIDSRRHFQGDHSLRMNNPVEKAGNRLSFYNASLDSKKSYTVSVMARAGQSSNKPGGKKGGLVQFRLALAGTGMVFSCTENWQKYGISGIRVPVDAMENGRYSPELELTGKGTAWFDLLQVFPDMELVEVNGGEGKFIVEIVSIQEGVKIFYTLDGTEPTISSSPYLVPLEISANDKLKAAAFKENTLVGYIER